MLTTGHSHLRADYVPAIDAETVRRLKAGGAVILGKLGTHEFANGAMTPDQLFPPVRNPWNTDYQPGGSSSGSGAAVAAAALHGRHGIRHRRLDPQPAGLCATAGIKPTYGLVSRCGIFPLCFSFDTAGPLAWTIEDYALMLDVLAGYDPNDQASAKTAKVDYGAVGPPLNQGHAHRRGALLVRRQGLVMPELKMGIDEAIRASKRPRRGGRGRRVPEYLGLSHLRPRRDYCRGACDPSSGSDRDAGRNSATRRAGASSSAPS